MVFSFSKPTYQPNATRDDALTRSTETASSPFSDAHHRPKNTSSPHSYASRTFVRAHSVRHTCLRQRLDRSMHRLYRHNGPRVASSNSRRPRSPGATSSAARRFASKGKMGKRSRRGMRLSRKSYTRCVAVGVETKCKCTWKWTSAMSRRCIRRDSTRLTD